MSQWAWDTSTGRPAPTTAMLAELSQLRAALPGYEVMLTSRSGNYRFEATRRPGSPEDGPWCLISADPADLWRELAPWTRYSADSGRAAEPPLNVPSPLARRPCRHLCGPG